LATATSNNRCRAARVAQAMCGVKQQFFAVNSGLSAEGGSVESTSRPAPAMRPEFNAAASKKFYFPPQNLLLQGPI
jgi:hypothetical protein